MVSAAAGHDAADDDGPAPRPRPGGFAARAGAWALGFAMVSEGYLRAEAGFSLRPILPLSLVLALFLLLSRGLADRVRLGFASVLLALGALMLLAVGLHAGSPGYDREEGLYLALAYLLTLPAALSAALLRGEERQAAWAGLVLGMGLSAAFESWVWVREVLWGIAPPLAYENLAYLFGPNTIRRLSAPYTGSNQYAAFCLMALVLGTHLLGARRGRLGRLLVAGLLAAALAAAALTFTRSVWLLAAAVLAWRLLPLWRRPAVLALLALAALPLALLAAERLASAPPDLDTAFAALADRASGDGDSGRLDRWAAALADLAEAPLLGVGWGQHVRAHNVWLGLAADAGLPAALAVLALAGGLWLGLRRVAARGKRAGAEAVAVAAAAEARTLAGLVACFAAFMAVDTALLGIQTWLAAGFAAGALGDAYAGRAAARAALRAPAGSIRPLVASA